MIVFCAVFFAVSFFASISQASLPAQNFYALYRAASSSRLETISRALARGLNIDTVNVNGDTGLCVAIRNNDQTAYRVFRHFGANPNHQCILNIPRWQYSSFMATVPSTTSEYEYTSASARYAQKPVYNTNTRSYSNLYSSKWLSSPVTWTIGGLALLAGGIAIGSSSKGGKSKNKAGYYPPSDPSGGGDDPGTGDNPVIPDLNGVDTTPVENKQKIEKTVTDSSGASADDLWAIYATDENDTNFINTADIDVTTDDSSTYNENRWGGIYAKNGYIYNSGNITLTSDDKLYATGLMACIVSVYNPYNTSCFVNEADTMVGDIYNEGNISITGNQSAGIFTSNVGSIVNKGNIDIQGNDSTGIFIYGDAENVVNDGSISLSGEGTDEFLAGSMSGIWASGTANITNNQDIIIQATGDSLSEGMYSKDGVLTNNGTIAMDVTHGAGMKTNDGSLTNSETGLIDITSESSNNFGMQVDGEGNAENYGTIYVTANKGYGMYAPSGSIVNQESGEIHLNSSSGYAMFGNETNINYGYISSTAGGMFGDNALNEGTIESTGTAMVTNEYAENRGTITSSSGYAMYSADEGNLVNSGTINAMYGMSTEKGYIENSGDITTSGRGVSTVKGNITNSGTIKSTDGIAVSTVQGTITNEEDATISSVNGHESILLKNQTSLNDDGETVIDKSLDVTINNAGTISLGVYTTPPPALDYSGHLMTPNNDFSILRIDAKDDTSSKVTVNNSGEMILDNTYQTIRYDGGKLSAISSNINQGTVNINNTGSITINNAYDEYISDSNIYKYYISGIEVAKGNVVNDGTITINNAYIDGAGPGDESEYSFAPHSGKNVVGIGINEGSAVNNGTITINSNNAIGMAAIYTGNTEDLDDDEVKVTAVNNGTIEMNGVNNIAMYAENKGAVITNAGTIIIKKQNLTDIHQKIGDTVLEETDDCNSFICLKNGGRYVNSGVVVSDESLNFNNINGITLLSLGSRFSAPSMSGVVYANYDIVTGSFDDVYTMDEDSFSGDTDDLEVRSYSSLFSANLNQNENSDGAGVSLTRKSFYDFTANQSVAQFLENNYQQNNNLTFYDYLKSTNTRGGLSQKIDQGLGLKLFPSFSQQVLNSLRVINSDISNNLSANDNDDEIRSSVGISSHYRQQDATSAQYGYEDRIQSVYGVVDKRYTPDWRVGLGLNYARINTKYDENNRRKNNLIQFFAPFIYHSPSSLYHFMSVPHAGFLWGKYKRHLEDQAYHADTRDFYYGITNELHRDIALEHFILEPGAELNFAGLYTSGMDDNAIRIKGHHTHSAEVGVGLYLKKRLEFANQSSLSFRAGGSIYQELLDPYVSLHGHLAGMAGDYKFNKLKASKTRSVLKTTVQYKQGQMNLFGELAKYIEDADGYEVNVYMKYEL